MVLEAIGHRENLVEVGHSLGGPFCNQVQPQVTQLCFPSPGRQSLASGRSLSRLDQPVGLCLSTGTPVATHPTEDGEGTMHHYTDSAVQALTAVVPSTSSTPHGPTVAVTGDPGPAQPTQVPAVPQVSRKPSTTRLEIIERAHRAQGFSGAVAHRAATARRPSTLSIYDSKWKAFTTWCTNHKLDPTKATPQVVGDFLEHI